MGTAPHACRRCLWRRVLGLKIAALVGFFLSAAAVAFVRGRLAGNEVSVVRSGSAAKYFYITHGRRLQQDLSETLDEVVDDSLACSGCTPDDRDDHSQRGSLAGNDIAQVGGKHGAAPFRCTEVRSEQPKQRCERAQLCEGGGRGVVNYMALHYCWLAEASWISVPLLVAGVVVAFYFLAETAEHYFSPAVAHMVTMLRLTPSTGGVTLLALGNGAPDLFASLAAISVGNHRIGLGAILSAGTFVSTFVVGCVALTAAPFTVAAFPFTRDVLFYAVSVCMLFAVYVSGVVYFWEAVGFICFYAVFVAVVVFTDQVKGRKDEKQSVMPPEKAYSDVSKKRDAPSAMIAVPGRTPSVPEGSKDYLMDLESDPLLARRSPQSDSGRLHDSPQIGWGSEGGSAEARGPLPASRRYVDKLVSGYGLLSTYYFWISARPVQQQHTPASAHNSNMKKAELGCCGSPGTICRLDLPVQVLLRATIPIVSPAKWNRGYATANIVFCPLVVLYMCSTEVPFDLRIEVAAPLELPLWSLVLFQSAVVGTAYFLMSKEPPDSQHILPICLAFVMSVFWISFMASELLGCIAALGVILKIPPSLLGLTVLAWGNSMGDLVGDVAVARNGQPALAMVGCFAGPMFNMLIGLGLALAMATVEESSPGYALPAHPSILIAFGFLITGLLGSLLAMVRSGFQITRAWGYTLVCWYVLFMAISILTSGLSPY